MSGKPTPVLSIARCTGITCRARLGEVTEADLTDTCRVNVPMDIHWLMDHQHTLIGSVWFTAGDGQAMVDMIEAGLLDLSPLQHNAFPLEQVNEAISSTAHRHGGFSNVINSPRPQDAA